MKAFQTDLIHFNYENKNGHIFQKNNIILPKLNNQVLFGELTHPKTTDITLSNVSHTISNIKIIGNALYGDIKILDTDKGKRLKELIKENIVQFRPRTTGIVNTDGTISNYRIYTFDAIIGEDAFDAIKIRSIKIDKILKNILT